MPPRRSLLALLLLALTDCAPPALYLADGEGRRPKKPAPVPPRPSPPPRDDRPVNPRPFPKPPPKPPEDTTAQPLPDLLPIDGAGRYKRPRLMR